VALSKPYISSGQLAGSNNATDIPQLAYTASFGNGVSGTISLENASPYRNAGIHNTSQFLVGPDSAGFTNGSSLTSAYGVSSNTFSGNSTGGNHMRDIVGNIRLGRAWGTLHSAAAVHQSTAVFYTPSNELSGHPDDQYGFAVSGAVEFKNLPTGVSDSLKLEASYGKGAARYVFTGGTLDTAGGGRFAKFDSGGTLGFGYV
jgi:hypothetical protein